MALFHRRCLVRLRHLPDAVLDGSANIMLGLPDETQASSRRCRYAPAARDHPSVAAGGRTRQPG